MVRCRRRPGSIKAGADHLYRCNHNSRACRTSILTAPVYVVSHCLNPHLYADGNSQAPGACPCVPPITQSAETCPVGYNIEAALDQPVTTRLNRQHHRNNSCHQTKRTTDVQRHPYHVADARDTSLAPSGRTRQVLPQHDPSPGHQKEVVSVRVVIEVVAVLQIFLSEDVITTMGAGDTGSHHSRMRPACHSHKTYVWAFITSLSPSQLMFSIQLGTRPGHATSLSARAEAKAPC